MISKAKKISDEFLTQAEVAELFRVDWQTVKSWYRKGTLPMPFTQGRRKLWLRTVIQDHLDKLQTAASGVQ